MNFQIDPFIQSYFELKSSLHEDQNKRDCPGAGTILYELPTDERNYGRRSLAFEWEEKCDQRRAVVGKLAVYCLPNPRWWGVARPFKVWQVCQGQKFDISPTPLSLVQWVRCCGRVVFLGTRHFSFIFCELSEDKQLGESVVCRPES